MSYYESSLPLATPLASKGYSLESDMIMGWRPKFLKDPIPLYFDLELPVCNEPGQKLQQIYQGWQPSDSFKVHSKLTNNSTDTYPFDFSEPSIRAHEYLSKRNKSETPVDTGMIKDIPEGSLIFDSVFEGGNLDQVYMVNENEYDLYMRPDTNTLGHMHWFYFSVMGIAKPRRVRFNIVNFSRNSPLYRHGLRPRVFSIERVRNSRSKGWEYGGENLCFSSSKINKCFGSTPKKPYNQLTFDYDFEYPNDKVWFATTVPYTLTRLTKFLNTLTTDSNSYETSNISLSVLCKSLSLIDIPILTITNPKVDDQFKKFIVVTGRIHPSETVGSWTVEGFLRFICSKHIEAAKLRNRFIFKVIPMTNPDGVILGNSRTDFNGHDQNRCFTCPSQKLHPNICSLKELIKELTRESPRKVFMYIDMHGHFCRKGAFMYGPYYPLHNPLYLKCRVIPKLLSERDCIFRFHSSRFVKEKAKKRTARVVISTEFNVINSYTLETSYFGYLDEHRETVAFEIHNLLGLGENVARTILEYHTLLKTEQKLKLYRAQHRRSQKSRQLSTVQTEVNEITAIELHDEDIVQHIHDNSPISYPKQITLINNSVPKDYIFPLTFNKDHHTKRNLEDIISVIKMECNEEEEESDTNESDSEDSEDERSESPNEKTNNLPFIETLRPRESSESPPKLFKLNLEKMSRERSIFSRNENFVQKSNSDRNSNGNKSTENFKDSFNIQAAPNSPTKIDEINRESFLPKIAPTSPLKRQENAKNTNSIVKRRKFLSLTPALREKIMVIKSRMKKRGLVPTKAETTIM
ncbi:unnamed protein product [Blepharisma stoltei]|uniref:Peptidase M14 domain-containing protein n=1 Tax=Blepharisma stoltei TaxID=1481888 RepID=A0AAU9JS82_9CILI|nr:unnamed protein product [Blepharisma stoltei]